MEISRITPELQDRLERECKKIKASYAEIRCEEFSSTVISLKGRETDVVSTPYAFGFFVRVLVDGRWGIATFTDVSELAGSVKQAFLNAKLKNGGRISLKSASQDRDVVVISPAKDFRKIPLKEKFSLVSKYNKLLVSGEKGVVSTVCFYSDSYVSKFFVNNHGARIFQSVPYVRFSYIAVARAGAVVEMYRGARGAVGGYEAVQGLEDEILEVSREAVALSKLPKASGGVYTVVLDPFMAGLFAHEAFGHLSEADHQYRSPKLLKQMALGKKIGSKYASIVDDPALVNGWGNFMYDDEGIRSEKVNLLTNGVITGRLHSLETAAKLNEKPNGHARAEGFYNVPIVRMSNTYFQPREGSLDSLVSGVEKGLLVVNWMGGMTAFENFTFTGMYGLTIENGRIGGRVRSVKLMGNVFETLKNIEGVSGKADFNHDSGTCGKAGQSIPVGGGGPYVRVKNVMVGGK